VQLGATCRTELKRSVGMLALAALSRVALAPDPVAPAEPVEPVVAPVGVPELDAFARVPRISTLLFTYLRRSDWSQPCSLYDVIDDEVLVPAVGDGGAPRLPGAPVPPVLLEPGAAIASARIKPEPAVPALPVGLPPLAAVPPAGPLRRLTSGTRSS
jgi:hypothetical protein